MAAGETTGETERVTFYLERSLRRRLVEAELALRDLGIKVNRSDIGQAALTQVLDEFAQEGRASALVQALRR